MFSWVKAHAGIYGNEIADKLAKKRHEAKAWIMSVPGYLGAPYTKKPKRQPGKNGNESGQQATKLLQPNTTFPQSGTE